MVVGVERGTMFVPGYGTPAFYEKKTVKYKTDGKSTPFCADGQGTACCYDSRRGKDSLELSADRRATRCADLF